MARDTERAPAERRNRDAEVLAVAIEVMAERGYAGTSLQEVADRVGVLKGSLYHYFSSKEELLHRILLASHEDSVALAEEVAALELAPVEELLEWLRRTTLWYLTNRQRASIFFTDRGQLTGDRLVEARRWGRTFESHIEHLVERAQEEGAVRSDSDARLITRYVLGAVNGVRFWPSRSGHTFDDEQIASTLVALTRSAISS